MHPEELLDKEARGTLTWAEHALLQAHAARCVACRCERRLRAEFIESLAREPSGARASQRVAHESTSVVHHREIRRRH